MISMMKKKMEKTKSCIIKKKKNIYKKINQKDIDKITQNNK